MTLPFGNPSQIARAVRMAQKHLQPPPDLLPSEYAERAVRIPAGNAIPGLIRFDNAPFQREPLDMTVNPDCRRITLMWGAQVGKTTLALCAQSYRIEQNPTSQMMMQPSQGDLGTWLQTKFNPMVEANKGLESLIAPPRGRKGVNNDRMKSYPGGFIMFAWSGSPKTMRGRSAPFIVCDETDGYDRTGEGHPVSLLAQRAASFGDEGFLLEISTPSIKGASWIEDAYEQGDQRRFYVACPHCGHHQTLRWAQVKWDQHDDGEHNPASARYLCAADDCGTLWNDGERWQAIRSAERVGAGWKAAKPFRGHASYHLNELNSTMRKLSHIVQSFLDKKAANDLQTFVNVTLAETWEEDGEQISSGTLADRAYQFPAPVPHGALALTAGIDMQEDRLEVETVGWGLGEESWSVDYRVIWGDPLQQDVWDELDAYLDQTWLHQSGAQLPVLAACLDTGGRGAYTQAAYEYARGKTGRRLFAIKGVPGWGKPIVASPSRKASGKRARKVELFPVGVDEAKIVVMRRLSIPAPGPGYCHFPLQHDAEYFAQMTAEKLVTRHVKGFPVREWHKTRPRNEVFDCRVYALAALKIANPNLARLAKRMALPDDDGPEPVEDETPVKADPLLQQDRAEFVAQVADAMRSKLRKAPEPKPENAPEEPEPNAGKVRRKRTSAGRARRRTTSWATGW